MTEKNEKIPLTRKEQLQIEGYKALMQYGVQLSQDHLNYDKILMPISLAPALWVISSPVGKIPSRWAETWILVGGVLLLLFWVLRNIRSRTRLYKVWDTVSCIEKRLCFDAYSNVHDEMKKSGTLSDFTLKFIFSGLVAVFYGYMFCHVWCR